jgi:tripartite-type tricarboxylate transporter receptor subunit TctC
VKLLNRKQFLHLTARAAALPAVSRIARAQTYPTRPITMIVPAAAGGATDVSARIVSEHISRTLGQQIVIENIAGAGGTTGTARTMRANPDGYTIEMGHMGTHALAVALYPKLAYKPDIDFEPTLKEFLAKIEKQYGKAKRTWVMDRGSSSAGF